ncbi:DoxX family protein [Pontibacter sp. 172403-2]|uniref:DoxX family protein n=1 Tax=Pontibacter rufus TaxID=2791028 RepID=UPI0018AFE01F|nr:DoxX family protein [Pontibacter sp. 172403-2]MBF9254267.1 DoxX family protein [Pontibacter sp. 172403-2]
MEFRNRLFTTPATWSLTIVRIFLGIVIFPHGAQKLLGWFGGPGPSDFSAGFGQMTGLPEVLGWLVIIIEFFGSLCLILGLLTRFWAFCILCLFIGIVLMVHLPNGFFMNWGGNQPGEGYEYHLLVIGMAWALVVGGPGRLSIDSNLNDRNRTAF